MSDEDWEESDKPCPKCGSTPTRWRTCTELDCEDGLIDEHERDPINFAMGEEYRDCEECCGTGDVHWCPKCGLDITAYDSANRGILP